MFSSNSRVSPTAYPYQETLERLRREFDILPQDMLRGIVEELDKLYLMVGKDNEEVIKVGRLKIDLPRHKASLDGSPLSLSPTEFRLLAFLARNRGKVFTREQLLEKVWGYEYLGGAKTVDVHIRRLRKKVEKDPNHPSHLITVRGAGYKLE